MVGRHMSKKWGLLGVGAVIVALGGWLAYATQTAGGIRIQDVRFTGSNGMPMSAFLYIPQNATAKSPAPGILAVHGYMNSRETQDGFAIEFARRGYVVLAIDQTGHGYSGAPAFTNGFGGPDGLRYLRSLDIVDKDNIGLEGHSMGGWTVLAAASAFPDGYRAVVLEGSATGRPFAQEGTPQFPRNLAVVFSRYDEFSQTMWGVPKARDVVSAPKLKKAFGTDENVIPGRLYGSIDAGTARILFTPSITHAQDHISEVAIGHSLDWFGRTLKGGTPLPPSDQIWYWKEIGTLIALVGFVVVLLGAFELLLALPYFAKLKAMPVIGRERRDASWWIAFVLGAAIPALTYLKFCQWGERWFPASRWLPQTLTSQIATWAALNAAIVFALSWFNKKPAVQFKPHWGASVLIAILTVAIGGVSLLLADYFFKIDFRYWVVALKPLAVSRFDEWLVYLVPFAIFFSVALRALERNLAVRTHSVAMHYTVNIVALTIGFAVLLAIQYGVMLATGQLFSPNEGLRVILAIQFVPLMIIVAIVATFTFRRTASYAPGALICALFVTWYIVAGQAAQSAG